MAEQEASSSTALTIGGAVLGAALFGSMGGASNILVGAVLGALCAQVLHLHRRARWQSLQLRELKARLDRSQYDGKAATAFTSPTVSPASSPVVDATVNSQPAAIEPSLPRVERPTFSAPHEPVARPSYIPPSAAHTFLERLLDRALAWIKGGNPLARIGIVILFFGAAFLAKYAADRSLFPIELRFAAIALGACALLIVGWRLRQSHRVYAEILQGGGVAGLYLTVFTATKFDLLPLGMAFGFMAAIALAAAAIAVAQNALSLAVIGTAGGFLAPILVSTGSGNHIALFTYYAFLNLGVFAVAWFRTWRVLNVLGFVFTFTITGLWRATAYESADVVSADAFLILFFVMYVGVSILNCVRQPANLKGYVSGSLVFGLPVVAFSLHASLVHRIEYALALSAVSLGAFYLALGWTLYRSGRESFRLLVEAFAALGVIFASLAIPFAFDTETTAAMWAVEGAGLLWLGVSQSRKLARAFGVLLQIVAGIGYLIGIRVASEPVFNSAFLGALLLALSGFFSGYWLYRNRVQQANYEIGAHAVFAFWSTAWWLFAGLQETDRFLHLQRLGAALTFVAATSALLAAFASKARWPVPRLIAVYLPALSALFGLAYAIDLSHPFTQWGALGWLLLILAHYHLLHAVGKPGEEVEPTSPYLKPVAFLHAGAVWVVVLLLAWEGNLQVHEYARGVWPALPWGVVPALMLALLGRRNLWPAWPLAQHEHAYRVYAGLPVAIATYVWMALINLTSDGNPVWLPYVPLFNPLDISVALSLAAIALWWTSLQKAVRNSILQGNHKLLAALMAALVFLWLNAALLRALHHNLGAPFTASGMTRSTLVQASLSIFWGLLGFSAMTVAAKRHWRIVWLVGVSLMIVVVAKLFLIDLSNSGTLARIASFLIVGALLLVTGYLAPLPPRRTQVTASRGDEVTRSET
jgi:uncharacterized membrane protein